MNLINFIKKIFCSHNYWDEINEHNKNHSIWQCSKYKKEQILDIDNVLSLDTELSNLTELYYTSNQKEWEKSHAKLINNTIADLKHNAKKGLYSWSGYIILENDDVKYFKEFFKKQHLEVEMKTNTKCDVKIKQYYVNIYWK